MSLLDNDDEIIDNALNTALLTEELLTSFGFKMCKFSGAPLKIDLCNNIDICHRQRFVLEVKIKKHWFSPPVIKQIVVKPTYLSLIYYDMYTHFPRYDISYYENDFETDWDQISTVRELNDFCIKNLNKSIL